MGPVIKALTAMAKDKGIRFDLAGEVQEMKAAGRKLLDAEVDGQAIPLQPQAIVRALREAFPADTAISLDGGNFAKHVRRHFEIMETDSCYHTDNFGTVGAAFPMALGVKAAQPERPVACLCGDGAFLLNSQELETAVRENLNVVVVVFNDFGFGNVRAYQEANFDGCLMCDHGNPPFDEMARLFGADGARVERLDELAAAVQAGLSGDTPFVIDVMMSRDALERPGFVED